MIWCSVVFSEVDITENLLCIYYPQNDLNITSFEVLIIILQIFFSSTESISY